MIASFCCSRQAEKFRSLKGKALLVLFPSLLHLHPLSFTAFIFIPLSPKPVILSSFSLQQYEGLKLQDLRQLKDMLIVETADMLQAPLFTAEALLRAHGMNLLQQTMISLGAYATVLLLLFNFFNINWHHK